MTNTDPTTDRTLCFGEMLLRLSPTGASTDANASFFASEARATVGGDRRDSDRQVDDPAPAAVFEAWWGGSEANVAVGLANLSRPVSFLTTLPDSEFGRAAFEALTRRDVEVLEPGTRTDAPMGLYFAAPKGHGKTVIYHRANSAIAVAPPIGSQVNWSNFARFHTSGITPALSRACATSTAELLATAKANQLVTSFDLNLRRQLWSDRQAGQVIRPMLSNVDLLIANAGQLASAFDLAPLEIDEVGDTIHALRGFATASGVQTIVITDRERREAVTDRAEVRLHTLVVSADGAQRASTPWFVATDRIGSGDAFSAALLANSSNDSTAVSGQALRCALAAASLANQSAGDFPTFSQEALRRRTANFFDR